MTSANTGAGRMRPRSLRRALLGTLVVTVAAWGVAQFVVSRTLFVDYLSRHELEDSRIEARRAANLVTHEVQRITRVSRDWSQWDDTHAFVRGEHPGFVEANLYPEVFANLTIDLMAFVAADGTPRYVESIDRGTGATRPLPSQVSHALAPGGEWLAVHAADRARSGLLSTSDGLIAYSAQPIHRSSPRDPGASAGVLVFARYLDASFMRQVSGILGVDVELYDAEAPFLADDVRAAFAAFTGDVQTHAIPLDDTRIAGYAPLSVSAGPGAGAALARVVVTRSGRAQARQLQVYLLGSILLLSVLAGAFYYVVIERRLLLRLASLDQAVDAIAKGGHFGQRIPESPEFDEVERLGRSVNAMLAELESQRDVRDARDAALVASRLKGEFLATMSHEVRTPFNGILAMLELALEDDLSPGQRERIETAYRSAHGLLGLMNDLLDFSRVDAGALILQDVDFDLRQLVEDTTVLFASRAHQRGLSLGCCVDPLLARRHRGDQHRLRQVLANLLSNALKFTDSGLVSVRVSRTAATAESEGIELSVSDTGRGIAAGQRASLFQPAPGAGEREQGAGIGLSICRQIVTQMGGVIDVDSTPGAGSRFRVTLWLKIAEPGPVAGLAPPRLARRAVVISAQDSGCVVAAEYLRAMGVAVHTVDPGDAANQSPVEADFAVFDETELAVPPVPYVNLPAIRLRAIGTPPVPARDDEIAVVKPLRWYQLQSSVAALDARLSRKTVVEGGRGTLPDLQGRRVLLVEDTAVNRQVVRQLLDGYRLAIEEADSGEDALALLEATEYDLVLMDWRLVNVDGIETTRRWRLRERALGRRRVPIVALTAYALLADELACRRAGMDDYLVKPLGRDALSRVVWRWLVHPPDTAPVNPLPNVG